MAGVTGCVDPATYPAPVPSSNGPACNGTVPASCSAATATCPHCAAGLKRWDANATWTNAGNRVPVSNATSDVTLPPSSRVLLSGCMLAGGARFRTITVPAGSEVRGVLRGAGWHGRSSTVKELDMDAGAHTPWHEIPTMTSSEAQ